MQWLVTFYCALMGAVQYYTLLPVGCDLAYNPCNLNTVPFYTLATIASAPFMPKVPLLDAAPVPLLLDGVPTCAPPTPAVKPSILTRLKFGAGPIVYNPSSTMFGDMAAVPGRMVRT